MTVPLTWYAGANSTEGHPIAVPQPYAYRNDPAVPDFPDDRPIIVFDGYCVLCSRWARFVLKYDRRKLFRLLPAQSPLGEALYVHLGLDARDYETNILIADGVAWFRSEGSIRMAEGLGFPWSLARVMRLLPLAWRDGLYSLVAKNRFRLFGRRDTCFLSDADHSDRFLA